MNFDNVLEKIKQFDLTDILVDQIKEKVLGEELESYGDHAGTLAVSDVTTLLAYITKNHKIIMKQKDMSLSDQLHNIVVTGEIINSLNIDKVKKVDACCSCLIFAVPKITYDNELLNNPEMFNKLVSIFGVNKVLDW